MPLLPQPVVPHRAIGNVGFQLGKSAQGTLDMGVLRGGPEYALGKVELAFIARTRNREGIFKAAENSAAGVSLSLACCSEGLSAK